LGWDDSFSAASAQRDHCLHSRLLAALLGEQWRPAQGQAASQQVVVPRNTHGSRAERREEGLLVRGGELPLLASLLLLRVLVSLGYLNLGSLATAGALDFSPASFYPELLPFVSLSVGKKYFSWYFHVLL